MTDHPFDEAPPRLNLDTPSQERDANENVAGLSGRHQPSDAGAAEAADGKPSAPAPGYGSGYGYGPTPERGHLVDYIRILHKRRWTAGMMFTVVFATMMVYTFTAVPMYDARAQLLIENQEQKVVQYQQVLDENRSTADYYQTQYRILQSRLLARRTLDAEKLWEHPRFAPPERSALSVMMSPLSWPGLLIAQARSLFQEAPAQELPDEAETAAQSAKIDRFLSGLAITPVRNSRLVDVRYRSPDPALAARVANALVRNYIEQALEFKFLATEEATRFLSARMQEQRKSLEQSEQALQKYREQTGAVALEDRQNIVVQRLADLNAAVTRARTERIEKEAVYNQIRESQNDRTALDTAPAILSNSFVQQLKAQLSDLQRTQAQMADKLGERHPDMVKVRSAIESTEVRIAAEVQKVVQALRNDYQAAQSNERALMASLDQQRGEAQELNRAAIQYGVLARDTTTNRTMFDGLLQRAKETDITGELRTSNIRIVDAAETPRGPSSPNTRLNLLIGLLGGAFLGIGLAFFFEYLDSHVKLPEEIKTQLGLPFLGMVPVIDMKALKGPPLLASGTPQDFGEAFRTIRTNVLFSSADTGSKSIVVTSTAPGEGKTVVSSNLAMSLAMSGQRVLLIDADMRRPKVHEYFRIKVEPGLSNVMVSNTKASDAVKRTSVNGLWVMPAGKQPPNPAELLGSKRFKEFLSSLGAHFDWVVIDSPPVMAVTDSAVIAHVVTGVVFVIGSEMTSQGAAKAALDRLDSARAKYVGGILNKVDFQGNRYYYAHYYHREYTDYYMKSSA